MQEGLRELCWSPDLTGYDSEDDGEDAPTDGPIVLASHQVNQKALELERHHAGQLFLTDKVQKLMKDMFDEVYTSLQPKRGDWEARKLVIQFIEKFVKFKIPGSSISAFGSFVMDLYTASSDLDLSLNLSDGKRERSRNDKVYFLRKVANALYGLQNGSRTVRGIEPVYRAAVPVVKFVECKTGIECDISVENNDGVLKSQVLGMFATIDTRFRQLCYLVKAWAKKHNVNSSKNGTLNSLSICLLVAFHLQTCSPPILPPFSVFMEGLYLPAVENCLSVVAARVRSFKDTGFGSDNFESVPELFGSLFVKLVAVENLWGHGLCSSTYEGKWISKIWPKNHIGCISVEDFADRTQNVARSVSRKEFELIYQCLHNTLSNLKDPVNDVMATKDLRVYLFGSIKQRYRASDNARIAAAHAASWQSANGWPTNEVRSQVSSNGLHQTHADTSIHVNQSRVNHAVLAQTVTGASGYGYNAQAGVEHKPGKSRGSYPGKYERVVNFPRAHAVDPESEQEALVTHIDIEYPPLSLETGSSGYGYNAQAGPVHKPGKSRGSYPRKHERLVNFPRAHAVDPEPEQELLVTHVDVEYPPLSLDAVKRRHAEQPTVHSEYASAVARNKHVYRNPYDGHGVCVEPSQIGQAGSRVVGNNRPGTYQPSSNSQSLPAPHQKHRRYGRGSRGRIPTSGVAGDVQPRNTINYQPRADTTVDGRWQT